MATIRKFEELEIWKEARRLSLMVYNISNNNCFSKDFRFRDQIRAAAGSVMDNIAEGFERSGRLEFINFLGYAKGSCGEVKSQVCRAIDQEYVTSNDYNELYNGYDNLAAKIAGFITYLNRSSIKGEKFRNRK